MKKFLMIILMASIISPAFALAEGRGSDSEESDNGVFHAAEAAQVVHFEKKESENKDNGLHLGWENNSGLHLGLENENDHEDANENDIDDADDLGFNATTTPPVVTDTTAPIISAILATGIATTSANVSWTTDEATNGTIYFGTSTPVLVATATSASVAVLSTTHEFSLTGLTASTTYYYVVKSIDAAGNIATSTSQSFTTAATLGTIAPVISGVAVSNIASTTATVSWNTNVPTTASLKYGTSTPLNLATANAVSTTTVATTHTFNLFDLIAHTLYNLFFGSTDASNNTATATASFTTTI